VQRYAYLWISPAEGTYINNAITSTKYYISNKQENIHGLDFIKNVDNYYLYENQNSLPIAYYMKDNIIDLNQKPFEMQNDFLSKLDTRSSNEQYLYNVLTQNPLVKCEKTIKYGEDWTGAYYEIEALEDTDIYLYSDYILSIFLDDKPIYEGYAINAYKKTGIINIKKIKKGEKIELSVRTKSDLIEIEPSVAQIYVVDYKKTDEVLQNSINNNKFILNEVNNTGLTGNVDFKEDGYLVFSIPYDENWQIKVNGRIVKTESINKTFLATRLNKGVYDIEIKYNPPSSTYTGGGITIISILVIFVLIRKYN